MQSKFLLFETYLKSHDVVFISVQFVQLVVFSIRPVFNILTLNWEKPDFVVGLARKGFRAIMNKNGKKIESVLLESPEIFVLFLM